MIAAGSSVSNLTIREYIEHKRGSSRIAGIALVILCSLFLFSWWNHVASATATDGFWFHTAHLLQSGQVPYRDFSLVLPPLHLLKTAASLTVFGDYLLVPRAVGLIERLLMTIVLFSWLMRLTTVRVAFLSSVAALVVSSTGRHDVMSDYVASASCFALLGAYAAAMVIAKDGRGVSSALWGLAAGALLSLGILERQTSGLIAAVCILVVIGISLVRMLGIRRASIAFLACLTGALIPLSITAVWLARSGALGSFIDQVFLRGPAAKGSLFHVLTRPVQMIANSAYRTQEAVAAAACLGVLIGLCWLGNRQKAGTGKRPEEVLKTVIGAAAAVAAGLVLVPFVMSAVNRPRFIAPLNIAIDATLFGTCGLFVYFVGRCILLEPNKRVSELALLSAAGLGLAYGNSLSWTPFEPMAFPGLAVVLMAFWPQSPWNVIERSTDRALTLACLCLVTVGVLYKGAVPFDWQGWREQPISEATKPVNLRQLAGMRVSQQTADVLQELVSVIKDNTGAGDTVLAYPYFPLLYALSGTQPPTFAQVHFLDVTPDYIAARDAHSLTRAKPAVLVVSMRGEDQESAAERNFPSDRTGLHGFVQVVKNISCEYRLSRTLKMPGTDREINVYIRNTR